MGPQVLRTDGETFENAIVYAQPGDDTAIKVVGENITIKNVIVYHPTNARGIFGWKPNGIKIENVEVIAYGNEWGAGPCPSRSPFNGWNCNNIQIYYADGVQINNVRVENGSKGISVVYCPGAQLSNVIARNPRGPFPAGQCFQI